VYTRRFGGTLFFLVLAAGLVKEATGQPHYARLATLLQRICPTKVLDERALGKKIKRFQKRKPEFVAEYLGAGQIRLKI